MASVLELYEFSKRYGPGRREEIAVVTAVASDAIDDFLHARTAAERTAHLRRLRDEGLLIHNRGRLTQRVRGHGVQRAYVFRSYAHQIPRVGRRRRPADGMK